MTNKTKAAIERPDWMSPGTEAKHEAQLNESAMNKFFFDTHYDTVFLRGLLPNSYELIDCSPKSAIRCKSRTGIRHNSDSDDNEHWEYIEKAISQHFGERLQEIYFNTHEYFQYFTIYIKP